MPACSRRRFLKSLGLGAAGLAVPRALRAAPKRKPNIVFFLVDDMGWMDSSVYGSEYYETPNMERLARRSMKFVNAYAANPLCSPTRASILTGKYPARLRITTPTCHLPPLPPDAPLFQEKAPPSRKVLLPVSRRFLPPSEYTIAEALADAGYRTCHIGKWHLGLRPEHWPDAQGFEVKFHGAPDPGPPSYHSPYGFKAGNVTPGPEGEYITDRVTDEALKFIDAHRDRPFILHLWHYAVHGPWGHKEAITKRFAKKQDPRGKQGNAIMASMLWSVDQSLGRVLDKLDALGIADDTVVLFFSDNGGNVHSNTATDPKMKRIKPGHRRWPMVRDWRQYAGTRPPTNNAPLRGGKATIWEGGTREPLLVRWPGVVQPGSVCSELVSSIDFYPTLLDITGARAKPGQVIDGVSLLPLLEGETKLDREAIFCHFPHSFGKRSPAATWVRQGDWKLIRVYDTQHFPHERMLFNLRDDIGETTNLAAQHPAKVKELDALIDRFLADTSALVPKPNPAYDPAAAAMERWVARGCDPQVEGGILTLTCKGTRAFIANASFRHPGPAVLTVRARRTAPGKGRVQWRTAGQKRFQPGHSVPFELPRPGAWGEASVKLPVEGTLLHLRLFPGVGKAPVEIDWIRLEKPGGTVTRTWQFGK
ncbi:MAG: sulfatase [Planctomycetota bacterium]